MSNKAVFLDRDGIINKNRDDYVKRIEEFEILPHVPKAIHLLNSANFYVIVISNQSAVNRGLLLVEDLNKIHAFLQNELSKYNAKINAIYYCPHRPDEACHCRKPKPGLILKAAKDHQIDLKASWLIGDKISDIQAAKSVGVKTIQMKTDGDLLKIVKTILNKYE